MSEAKNHHLVPVVLLTEFTDHDCPAIQQPYVWVRSVGSKDWRKKAPKNIACENNFYRLDEPQGEDPLRIEKSLGAIESALKSV